MIRSMYRILRDKTRVEVGVWEERLATLTDLYRRGPRPSHRTATHLIWVASRQLSSCRRMYNVLLERDVHYCRVFLVFCCTLLTCLGLM